MAQGTPFQDETEIDVDLFLEHVASEAAEAEDSAEEYDEVTLGDIVDYETLGPSTTAPRIASISFRHHRMAQLIALGYSQTKVSDMLGCTIATVNRLVHDPTFIILVEDELDKLSDRDHCLQVKLAEVAEVGLDKLHEMLTNDESELKPTVVRDITMDVLDRAGHGPSKQVSVSKTFGIQADTLERIKSNVRPARRILPAIEQAPTCQTADLQVEVGGADGESIRDSEASTQGSDGPGAYIPTQILEIVGKAGK